MLLAIDIGNSTIVWGVFQGQNLTGHWRLASEVSRSPDEYGILFITILQRAGIPPEQITDVIVSSVVPSLTPVFDEMGEAYFNRTPLIVSPDLDMGIRIAHPNPREIGSDRLVNAAGAYARYRTSLIIVDFGTATTFCAVSAGGEYLGGAIAPGLKIACEALFQKTAKLPKVELSRPKSVIGKDTRSSIQSGLIFGYAGLVDELVTRMRAELGQKALVIATGGQASLIAPESRTIQEVRPYLTLEGLEVIYRRTRGER
jgi:type III pantothenate kinase